MHCSSTTAFALVNITYRPWQDKFLGCTWGGQRQNHKITRAWRGHLWNCALDWRRSGALRASARMATDGGARRRDWQTTLWGAVCLSPAARRITFVPLFSVSACFSGALSYLWRGKQPGQTTLAVLVELE